MNHLFYIIHLETWMCMCIVSIITHHQEYTICTSINHPHRHTGRRQRWRRSQIIYLLEEQILPQKLNAKIIFDTVIIIKSLLSLFKINKDRTVLYAKPLFWRTVNAPSFIRDKTRSWANSAVCWCEAGMDAREPRPTTSERALLFPAVPAGSWGWGMLVPHGGSGLPPRRAFCLLKSEIRHSLCFYTASFFLFP